MSTLSDAEFQEIVQQAKKYIAHREKSYGKLKTIRDAHAKAYASRIRTTL